jgi:ABC-type dipeptide/oligopeptide/nickel transport system ATPase component
MARLMQWLAAAESRRVAIVGQGGSGKTSLAQWFLKVVRDSGVAGGVRLVFFLQGADIMQGYRALLERLKSVLKRGTADPDKDEEVRSLVHRLLQEGPIAGKWVCVLDDLPDPARSPQRHVHASTCLACRVAFVAMPRIAWVRRQRVEMALKDVAQAVQQYGQENHIPDPPPVGLFRQQPVQRHRRPPHSSHARPVDTLPAQACQSA